MRKLILVLMLVAFTVLPVRALDITAPEVPDSGSQWMPDEADSFWEGLMQILRDGIRLIRPDIKEASSLCLSTVSAILLVSLLQTMSSKAKGIAELSGAVVIAFLLLSGTNSLIRLGTDTVRDLSEYGKLLLPVMTAALAAQGGLTSATALYAGTAVFDAVLTAFIHTLLVPMIYFYLALASANSAIGDETLKKLRDLVKWLMTWILKILLYVFTCYMAVTGVVSGTTDAAALKAAKLTISGMVPVVGGILSDASEAVLVSAATVKNAAGIYGILAVMSVCLEPFIKIGTHYLMLKATAGISSVFGPKRLTGLVSDFTTAMGMLLAMTGAVCLLLLISTVCVMKGVS